MAIVSMRVATRNHAAPGGVGAFPVLKAPLPPEDPLWPATNLLIADRSVRWLLPSQGGSAVTFIVDVGSGKTTHAVGLAGIQRAPGAAFPYQLYIYAANTYPDPSIAGCTANGTATVTRASGSFVTDGVKVGQTITLAGAATVPGGTTVLAVSALSLTMSNAASGSGTVTVTTTDLVALTPILTFGSAADLYYYLPAPVAHRYFMFTLPFVGADISIANPIVAQMADLAIAYSPGTLDTLLKRGVSNLAVNGLQTFTQTGPDGRRFSLRFLSIPGTMKDTLFAAFAARVLTIIHPTYGSCQVALVDPEVSAAHQFSAGATDLWDIEVDVETLP